MSRTYRNSQVTNYWPNLESYERKEIEYAIQRISDCEATKRKYPDRDMPWLDRTIAHSMEEIGTGVDRARIYFSYFRDGDKSWWSYNKKSFRNHSNRNIRTKTRHLERKILKDSEAYDNLSFPDKQDTKQLYWCYD